MGNKCENKAERQNEWVTEREYEPNVASDQWDKSQEGCV